MDGSLKANRPVLWVGRKRIGLEGARAWEGTPKRSRYSLRSCSRLSISSDRRRHSAAASLIRSRKRFFLAGQAEKSIHLFCDGEPRLRLLRFHVTTLESDDLGGKRQPGNRPRFPAFGSYPSRAVYLASYGNFRKDRPFSPNRSRCGPPLSTS